MICTLDEKWLFFAAFIAQVIVIVIEHWFAVTDKTKAGSIIQWILMRLFGVQPKE